MADEPIAATGASSAPAGGGAATPAGNGAGGSEAGSGAPPQPQTLATGTIAGGNAPEPQTPAPQTWPDDWRQRFAGDDKSNMKTLERFTDPAGVFKAYKDLQAKMSSGNLVPKAPGADAPPEVVATWRKENGIPEAPDGYMAALALPNGMVPGETDKPVLAEFAKAMHAENVPPGAFNKAVAWYYDTLTQQARQQQEQDHKHRVESDDALRREWGPEYRPNLNGVTTLLASADDATRNEILNARGPSGRPLGDNPGVLRFLAGLSREINPMAALLPAGTSDPMKGGEARIKEIESIMGTKAYWGDPNVQKEYIDLVTAREAMKPRAA